MTNNVRKAGPLQGFTLLSCMTLAVMGALLVAPVIPQMMEHFKDVPNVEYWVPMVVTVPSLCVALLSPVAGWLGDKFGRRRLLIPSMAIYSAFGLAPLFLHDLTHILISRIGVGITEAAVMTLSTTMIGDMFEGKSRDRWLAGQTATASTSAIIFLFIAGQAGKFGWQGPFVIYAFPLLIMAALILFTWETKESRKSEPMEPHVFNVGEAPPPITTAKTGFPSLFMLGVCVVTLFASLMFYTIQINLSQGLDAIGVKDPGQIGTLTAIASIAVPVGTFVFWFVSKRLPIAVLLLVEFAIMGGAYVGMSKMTDPWQFVGFAALSQIGAGMILPTLLTWAMSRLSFENRGIGTGIWQSIFAFGQFATGIVFAYLSATLHYGIIPTFMILGFSSIGAALLALIAAVAFRAKPTAELA
ncbi:MAG: MFS transporter [Asticcacaulis sp.]|uniref:MFS transporter n=1 Tax=Asticcacaulis sp. TaxID=1872648 RepID=UPI0039E26C5E